MDSCKRIAEGWNEGKRRKYLLTLFFETSRNSSISQTRYLDISRVIFGVFMKKFVVCSGVIFNRGYCEQETRPVSSAKLGQTCALPCNSRVKEGLYSCSGEGWSNNRFFLVLVSLPFRHLRTSLPVRGFWYLLYFKKIILIVYSLSIDPYKRIEYPIILLKAK